MSDLQFSLTFPPVNIPQTFLSKEMDKAIWSNIPRHQHRQSRRVLRRQPGVITLQKVALVLVVSHIIAEGAASVESTHILFTKIGETGASIHYANLRFSFNTVSILEMTERLRRKANRAKQEGHPLSALQEARIARLHRRAEALQDLGVNVVDNGPQKRFIVTLLISAISVGAVAGSAYGIYKVIELASIAQDTAETQQHLQKADVSMLNATTSLSQSLRVIERISSRELRANFMGDVIENAEEVVTGTESAYSSAVLGKLSLSLISSFNFTAILTKLRDEARANNFLLTTFSASDLIQGQASFVHTDSGFDVLLHVPMITDGSAMAMFRFIPLPIPIPDSDLHLRVASQHHFLAVSQDTSHFRALSQEEFSQCIQWGDFYQCKGMNYLRKFDPHDVSPRSDPELCLFALYKQHYDQAKLHCEASVHAPLPYLAQLSSNKFLLYSNKPHQGRISCTKGTTPPRPTFSVHGATTVTIPDKCIGMTNEFTFFPSDIGFQAQWSIEYDLPDLSDFRSGLLLAGNLTANDIKEFHQLAEMTDINLQQAQASLNMAKKAAKDHSPLASLIPANSSMAAGALFLVILAIIAAGISKACRKNSDRRHDANSIAVTTNPHISINMATADKAKAGMGASVDTPPPYRFPPLDSAMTNF